MQFENEDVALLLNGQDSVRDSYLESLFAREIDYRLVVELDFYVPRSTIGNYYHLTLRDVTDMEYTFYKSNIATQIPFVKCLWTPESEFYLSLDPWMESERFISDQDAGYFRAKHARLEASHRQVPEGATFC